jgi:DNA-binding transcriptional ArsR family regulator
LAAGHLQLRDINDPRLVKALAHPLRIQILRVLQNRVASPSEIADELSARLPNVSYHVRFLERIGVIELVRTRPRRGAVEHYYKARGRLRINDAIWAQVPDMVKSAMVDATLAQAVQGIAAAASFDGFSRKEALAGRLLVTLDEQGFRELSGATNELAKRAVTLEKESRQRLAANDHEAPEIRTGLVMTLYEAAPIELDPAATPAKSTRAKRRTKA